MNPINGTVGQAFDVTPAVEPTDATNKKVNVTIDDESIAKIDSGYQGTLLKAGTTTAHLVADDGSGVKVDVPITVTEA